MIKAALTIGTAAIVAGLVSILPAPQVEAGTPKLETVPAKVESVAPAPAATADRLEVRTPVAGCSQRAWPYYDQACLVDSDASGRAQPRKVRLVTTDRLN